MQIQLVKSRGDKYDMHPSIRTQNTRETHDQTEDGPKVQNPSNPIGRKTKTLPIIHRQYHQIHET